MIISSKSYMGNKKLVSVTVDADTTGIGDWAYANCANLTDIRIPIGCRTGDSAFYGCIGLKNVFIYDPAKNPKGDIQDDAAVNRGTRRLLAMGLTAWPKQTSSQMEAASDDREYLTLFDELLPRYLDMPDDSGFKPFFAGGEEDYNDVDEERESYINGVRMKKVFMIYERLAAGEIESSFTCEKKLLERYTRYLAACNPDQTFKALIEESDHSAIYRSIYFDMGLDREVPADVLLDLCAGNIRLRSMVLNASGQGGSDLSDMEL